MRIHKTLAGMVDLDHLLAVDDAFFDDRMGSGGYFGGYTMFFALRDEPVRVYVPAEYGEYSTKHTYPDTNIALTFPDGSECSPWERDPMESVFMQRVVADRDALIKAWSGKDETQT